MRTVEISRHVDAPPAVVEDALDPASIVEYEGSFNVLDIREDGNEWVIVAGGSGLQLVLRFEKHDNGVFYEQEKSEGQPLDTMETTITYLPEDGGTKVTAVSEVSMGVRPAAVTDRIAAWKRKGELERALDALAEDVEESS